MLNPRLSRTRSRSEKRQRAPRRRIRRPFLEPLEERRMLAVFGFDNVLLELELVDQSTGQLTALTMQGGITGSIEDTLDDFDGDGLQDVPLRLTSLNLNSFDQQSLGPIQVTLNPAFESDGFVEERLNTSSNLDFPADSALSVFFQVEVTQADPQNPNDPPQVVRLHNNQPANLHAIVSQSPLGVDEFFTMSDPIDLVDPFDNPTGLQIETMRVAFQATLGEVHGQKFEDVNANGVRDVGEDGLDGWVVALVDLASRTVVDADVTHSFDVNDDGSIDPGTEQGLYAFDRVEPGRYFVTELSQAGWMQSVPAATPPIVLPHAGPGVEWVGTVLPHENFVQFGVIAEIDWGTDGNLDGQVDEEIYLAGGIGTFFSGARESTGSNGVLDTVDFEFASFNLSGLSEQGPIDLIGGDQRSDLDNSGPLHSSGTIVQQAENTSRADVLANLQFEMVIGNVGGQGGRVLTIQTPLQLAAEIDRLPWDGIPLESQGSLVLVNESGAIEAQILSFDAATFRESALRTSAGYVLPLSLGQVLRGIDFGNHDGKVGPFGFDFGDAPDEVAVPRYPTLNVHDGARHGLDGKHFLGNAVDPDVDGQPDPLALGDDLRVPPLGDIVDDEDGVFFQSPVVPGNTTSLTVQASRSGMLNAFFDFNADGDWSDVGEHVFIDTALTQGGNVLTLDVPANAAVGQTTMARFRFSSESGLSYDGPAIDGEVEDYVLSIVDNPESTDFGDAPASYQTLLADNGPSHEINGFHFLGSLIDGENDGQPTMTADGDDVTAMPDEDGIQLAGPLMLGEPGGFLVQASNHGYLNGWVDFNRDGDFLDQNEQILLDRRIGPGQFFASFNVPDLSEGARTGESYARFRFTSGPDQATTPSGAAPDGEVEDLRVTLHHPELEVESDVWNLAVNPNLVEDPDPAETEVPGIRFWGTGGSDGEGDDDGTTQIEQQWFWFRVGDESAEQPLDSLELTGVTLDEDAGTLQLIYGDASHGDPIRVEVSYTLTANNVNDSTIQESVRITNLTNEPLDLHWFEYTDANLNGGFGNADRASLQQPGQIEQSGRLGSTLNVEVTGGPLPDQFEIGIATDLAMKLNDALPTTLDSAETAAGPADIAHAFQWDLTLDPSGEGSTVEIEKIKQGEFFEVVLPPTSGGGATVGRNNNNNGGGGGGTGNGSGGSGGGNSGGGNSGGGNSGAGNSGGSSFNGGNPPVNRIRFFDPALAVGYDYTIDTPNRIRSVRLPTDIGDNQFTLRVPDGSGGNSQFSLLGGVEFVFTENGFPSGVSAFRILGIETDAEINVNDPVGFPTGLTFMTSNSFGFSMEAIPDEVFVDPLNGFAEEANLGSAFGEIETGDLVTWLPGTPQAETGLIFGKTAFRTRDDAEQFLASRDLLSISQIVVAGLDFGDAPQPFSTLLEENGPVHRVDGTLFLGSSVDTEEDGQRDAAATGDDLNGQDDEDGVRLLTPAVVGSSTSLELIASAEGQLNAWIDFNSNGRLDDPGEHVFIDQTLSAGISVLPLDIPLAAAITAGTLARFRFNSDGNLGPEGIAQDGEVEDHFIAILDRPRLSGRKFEDLNGNGRPDSGEPFLNGWLVELLDANGQQVGTTTTDDLDLDNSGTIDPLLESGWYQFVDLDPGAYQVREAARDGWTQTSPNLIASLRPENEVQNPPVESHGTGAVWMHLDQTSGELYFNLDFDNLLTPTTGVHIHDGSSGTNGSVIHDLAAAAGVGPGFTGPISGTVTLSNDEIQKAVAGDLYINLHTQQFLGGELRDQIRVSDTHAVTLVGDASIENLHFGNREDVETFDFPGSNIVVTLTDNGAAAEVLQIRGTSQIAVQIGLGGATVDSDNNQLDDASTELTQMSFLRASSEETIEVRLNSVQPSLGRIEERVNGTNGLLDVSPFAQSGTADASFDVFFEVLIDGQLFRPANAVPMNGEWSSLPPQPGESLISSGSFQLVNEAGEPTGIEVTEVRYTPIPDAPWQNPSMPFDINADGVISPVGDVLTLINEINRPMFIDELGNLPLPPPDNVPPPFLDPSGDDRLTPVQDILALINFINAGGNSAGEGEAGPARPRDPFTGRMGTIVPISGTLRSPFVDSLGSGSSLQEPRIGEETSRLVEIPRVVDATGTAHQSAPPDRSDQAQEDADDEQLETLYELLAHDQLFLI